MTMGNESTTVERDDTDTPVVLPDGGDSENDEDDGGGEDESDGEGNDDGEDEPETHELTIIVENADGDPVSGAPLTVASRDLGIIEGLFADPETAETDEDGEATVELANAEYSVETELDGEKAKERVEIDGDDETVTLALDIETADADEAGDGDEEDGEVSEEDTGGKGDDASEDEGDGDEAKGEDDARNELTVTVETAEGEYVQGATVTVTDKDDSFGVGERQDTGTDGEATLLLEDGEYAVSVDAEGGSAEDQFVVEDDEEITLTLVPDEETYELSVTVQNDEGEPVSGASITVESEDLGVIEGFRERPSEAETDDSGQSSFDLTEGQYTVTVEKDNETNDQAVEIDGGDEEATLTLDVGEDEEDEDEAEDDWKGLKQAEGRVDEDESASHGTDRGTTVLYLDLEGLFLDLLGLEVDLHEVVLDVRAITGPGNLLGNLLSAVAGLLNPLSTLLNRLLNTVLNLLSYITSPLKWLWNQIRKPFKWARRLLTRIANALSAPVDWLRSIGNRVWNVVTNPIGALKSAASRVWGVLTSPIGALRGAIGQLREALPGLPSPREWLQRAGNRLKDYLRVIANRLGNSIENVVDRLRGPFEREEGNEDDGDEGGLLSAISQRVRAVADGITSRLRDVANRLSNWLTDPVRTLVSALPIEAILNQLLKQLIGKSENGASNETGSESTE